MKVIVLKEDPKVGKVGDVKDVKDGYAFNFLIPQGIAEIATPGALQKAEALKKKALEKSASEKREVELQANALRDRSIVIRTKAEEGRLFGSIGRDEIVSALSVDGIEIDPKILDMPKPFRKIGQYEIQARFPHGITAAFEVKILAE